MKIIIIVLTLTAIAATLEIAAPTPPQYGIACSTKYGAEGFYTVCGLLSATGQVMLDGDTLWISKSLIMHSTVVTVQVLPSNPQSSIIITSAFNQVNETAWHAAARAYVMNKPYTFEFDILYFPNG